MLIVGAGGLATQLIEDLVELKRRDIVFWSEVKTKYPFIEEMFPLFSTDEEVANYFATVSTEFVLCVGNDRSDGRRRLSERFKRMGGEIISYISPFSRVSPYGTSFGQGTLILNQVNVEPGVVIGEECISEQVNRVIGL